MLTIEKKERLVFFAIFCLSAGFVLLDRLTAYEINRNLVYFILLFAAITSLLLMVCEYLFGELSRKFITALIAIVFCACFGMAVLSWRSDWKTQTVLYRNLKNPRETIEYRMRGKQVSFVYDKQIVHRKKCFPFVDRITAADTSRLDKMEWQRVDIKVNQMGFPGEYVDLPGH